MESGDKLADENLENVVESVEVEPVEPEIYVLDDSDDDFEGL